MSQLHQPPGITNPGVLKSGRQKVTIGLISTPIWSWPSGLAFVNGVTDCASDHNANLICFQSNFMDTDSPNNPFNRVHEIVSQKEVDGLIIWASSYISQLGVEGTSAFCERFRPLPIVSIGMALPGIPGILIDSYQGMRAIMEHLTQVHHYRKIALIQGPEGHYDSQERLRAYRDALAESGLPFDPVLVSPHGGWDADRAQAVLRYFWDEQNVRPDALVAPGDRLGLSIVKELSRLGILVPHDIAVIGLNNEPEGQQSTPQLTTASILIYERAYLACQLLLQILAGQSVPPQLTLQSELIVRRSCGCLLSSQLTRLETAAAPLPDRITAATLAASRPELTARLAACLEQPVAPPVRQQLEQLTDAFITEMTADAPPTFILRLERILNYAATSGQDPQQWQAVIAALRHHASHLADPVHRIKADNLWYQSTTTFLEANKRFLLLRQNQAAERNWKIHHFSQQLNSIFELPQLLEVIANYLIQEGFTTFYLSLYEKPEENLKQARLMLAYYQSKRLELTPEEQLFALPHLTPPGLRETAECQALILVPLYYEATQLGFILLERLPFFMNGIIYASLQIQLGSALWRTWLFLKQKQTEEALLQHSQNLIRSNSELQQFAYVASHDLQEPLRKIIMFSGRLQETSHQFNVQELDYLDRMQKATQRMQKLISDLLTYSRVTTKAQPFTTVELSKVANEVMADLAGAIAHSQAQIEIDPLPVIQADPLQMRQLFQNLMSNALKFHRAPVAPQLKITATLEAAGTVTLHFTDNGIGIAKEYCERVFILFERLHGQSEYEGSGIGLTICKKIVDRHGGSISLESTPGVGSTFMVTLPIRQEAE